MLSSAAFVRGEEEDILHNDATWLLDFYDTFKDFVAQDITDAALSSLAQVIGRFGQHAPFPPMINAVLLCSGPSSKLASL
jgi:hypothetical protein